MSFVHLHVHTEYSLMDGLLRIPELAKAAAALHLPAMAITELASLYSAVKFYRAMRARGVKPLLGAELYLQPPKGERPLFRTILLCQHQEGYKNLSRLVTLSFTHGQVYGTPTVRPAWLGDYSEGLIAINPMEHGVPFLGQHPERAPEEQTLHFWKRHFPARLYLEVCRVGQMDQDAKVNDVLALATKHDVPIVASNDVRFLRRSDYDAHEARVCISQSCILGEPGRRTFHYTEQQYLRGIEEMQALFEDLPEAMENTVQIAMRCNVELTLGEFFLPRFPVPEEDSEEAMLDRLAKQGLAECLEKSPAQAQRAGAEQYQARLIKELEVIHGMGYSGYFLIVQDFVRWAREQSIPVGPGRGSGAGSLVAWALGITEIDPLHFDLLFERFLNPERVSLPDFDIDFCMDRRDEVIEYVTQKYGSDHVARIITYGTMAAKAVVRDVGRVLGHPYGFVDQIARMIPFRLGITLKDALEEEELANLYRENDEVRTLIDLALKLEGLTRNVSTHAGGLVIAPRPLTEYMPLYCEADASASATQYDMGDVEAMGLVKFDFLGLRTLTIIDWSMRDINKLRRAQGQPEIDINALPLDDPDTYALIQKTDTTAVFQLESDKLRSYMKDLKPDSFDKLFAMVALYRPGPIGAGMVDDFIKRRHGAEFRYLHDSLRPILEQTLGVVVYQEQVMQIAQVLAGYSLGEADLLRRAMGKKKPEEMQEQRAVFMRGAKKNGIASGAARKIFDQMEHFAGYGFNKSHSVAYALIAYRTAWLKAHYPAPFMAAALSADLDNTDKLDILLADARRQKVDIQAPSVNHGDIRFAVVDERTIRYGLSAIKGVGRGAMEDLTRERQANGPFGDLYDLCRRVDLRRINRRALEALIKAGAMDVLGTSRAGLMAELDAAVAVAEQHGRDYDLGQDDMFGLRPAAPGSADAAVAGPGAVVEEWDALQRLNMEKEALGLYFSGHPLQVHEQELAQIVSHALGGLQVGSEVTVAGYILAIRRFGRKSKGRWSRRFEVRLGDNTDAVTVHLSEALRTAQPELIVVDRLLIAAGRVERDKFDTQGYSIHAEKVYNLERYRSRFGALGLSLLGAGGNGALPAELRDILLPYRNGDSPVWIEYGARGARARIVLGADWKLQIEDQLLHKLRAAFGKENVKVVYKSSTPPHGAQAS